MAAEPDVECHRVFAAAFGEDVLAERAGDVAVEDALLLEEGEGVGFEYLGPFVAIVACRITAAEDVGEGRRHGRTADVGRYLGRCGGRAFELLHTDRDGLRNGVPCHVVHGEAELPHVGVCGQVVFGGYYLVDEFLRHLFTAFVVHGEQVEELFLRRPVLHYLRGQFDEVLVHGRPREGCVFSFREEAVETVAEFV